MAARTDRLGKLLRMMASANEGEWVAAKRAIDKELASMDKSWNDVAELLANAWTAPSAAPGKIAEEHFYRPAPPPHGGLRIRLSDELKMRLGQVVDFFRDRGVGGPLILTEDEDFVRMLHARSEASAEMSFPISDIQRFNKIYGRAFPVNPKSLKR